MYEIFEQLLHKHGVSTYQVSKATGISQSTFSNWKNRRNSISSELGKKIANFFDVPLDYLMGNSFVEELGHLIQEERIDLQITQAELAAEVGLSITELESYEAEDEPIREDIFNDILTALGTTHLELLEKYGLYDGYIPPHFNGDVVRYEAFKRARDKEAGAKNSFDSFAQDNTERRLLMLCRKAGDVPPEEKEAIVRNFEATIDMYLRAKGIKKGE